MHSVNLFVTLTFLFCAQTTLAQISISAAKSRPLGSVVTIAGIITSGSEFGDIRYVQDSTAGIAAYPGDNTRDQMRQLGQGDLVEITGVLIEYRGLLELSPVLSIEQTGQGATLPDPFVGSFEEALSPLRRGSRIRVDCAVFEVSGQTFEQGKYRLYDQTGTVAEIVLDEGHPLLGHSIPVGTFSITGISHYEYKERFQAHGFGSIEPSECLMASPPEIKQIWNDGAVIEWTSTTAGFAQYRYGSHPDSLIPGIVLDSLDRHLASVGFFDPATVFYFQPGVTVGETSAWAPVRPFITASESSGSVAVYFNNPIQSITGIEPSGTSFGELMDAIFELIESADRTIDIAMYNINRDDIVNALEVAEGRGVRVRYIADADQGNTALDPLPDFPVLFRNGPGIMHNKFIVVDADDPMNARVWTGATNFTSNQLSRDPNNAIVIQDQALARVFTMEFDEMWGGSADIPNNATSRTGPAKYDNTPHVVNANGLLIDVYFSPSDYVSHKISGIIEHAASSIDIGLLLITHEGLARDLVEANTDGVLVRGIYNDPEFSGTALSILENGGVQMYDYTPASIFHHKYMIVDAATQTDAVLLTGSHNWTYSAENINDENTLVIHSRDIAGLYLDEFESRLSETITTTTDIIGSSIKVVPNPFGNMLEVQSDELLERMSLISMNGSTLATSSNGIFFTAEIPAGMYLLEVRFFNGTVCHIKVARQ